MGYYRSTAIGSDQDVLSGGFSLVGAGIITGDNRNPSSNDDEVKCPTCGAIISGPQDCKVEGNNINCLSCGGLIIAVSDRETDDTPTENEEAINREEWGEAFDELFDPERDGDHDYETD